MAYKDPEKQRAANRRAQAKRRAAKVKAEQEKLGAPDLPDPPTDEELRKLLGVKAREGNVPAIRLLLEEYRRDASPDEQAEAESIIDELAKKRTARRAA